MIGLTIDMSPCGPPWRMINIAIITTEVLPLYKIELATNKHTRQSAHIFRAEIFLPIKFSAENKINLPITCIGPIQAAKKTT